MAIAGGGGGPLSLSLVPHAMQNFAFSGSLAPHWGHTLSNRAPQSMQNLASGGFSKSHWGQFMRGDTRASLLGRPHSSTDPANSRRLHRSANARAIADSIGIARPSAHAAANASSPSALRRAAAASAYSACSSGVMVDTVVSRSASVA